MPFSAPLQVKFLRLSRDASHVRGGGFIETALPRGKSVLPRRFGAIPFRLDSNIIPQIQACGRNYRTCDDSAAGLSGLSLPDALCEHTSIRANAANLTGSWLVGSGSWLVAGGEWLVGGG